MTESSGTGAGDKLAELGAVGGGDLAAAAARLDELLDRESDMNSRIELVLPLYRALMAAPTAERDAAVEVLVQTKLVLQQVIVVALIEGELDQADRWCDRLVAHYSGDYQSLLLKSTVEEFRQDFRGALATADLMVKLFPGDSAAHLRRARVLFAAGIVDGLPGGREETFHQAVAGLDDAIRLNPGSTWSYLTRARTWLLLEQPDRAVEDYTAALEIDPTLVDAYRERAGVRQARGQLDLALADRDAVTKLAPEDATAWTTRGDVELALGDDDAAIRAYDRAVELDPQQVEALIGRARAYAAQGELQRALADCQAAIQLDPDNVVAVGQRGDLLAAVGDQWAQWRPKQAVEAYERAIGDYDQLIELAPRATEGYINRARVRVKLGQLDHAVEDYTRALRLDRTLVDAYRERGLLREARHEFQLALADFEAVTELNPSDAQGYVGRGNALVALGDNFGALASYDRALVVAAAEDTVVRAAAYRGRGVANLGIGDGHRARRSWGQMWTTYEAAVASCEKARDLAPGELLTSQYLGRGLRALGAYDLAAEVLQQALGQLDGDDDVLRVTLLGELGQTLRLWGIDLNLPAKIEEAVRTLDDALAHDTNPKTRAWNLDVKGSALLRLDELPSSLVQFEQAIREDPSYGWPYVGLGKVLFILESFESAVEAFEQILRLGPGYEDFRPWGHVGLGLTLLQRGDEAKGTERLNKALREPVTTATYLNRAEMCKAFRAIDQARADREQAVEMSPMSAEAHNALAWMIVGETTEEVPELELGRAAKHAKRAVELSEGSKSQANYLDTLGWVKFRLGHYREAVPLLQESSRLRPRNLLARVHREQAEEALRQAGGQLAPERPA
jgi:tetratricopeptide (TPR) repeat protein